MPRRLPHALRDSSTRPPSEPSHELGEAGGRPTTTGRTAAALVATACHRTALRELSPTRRCCPLPWPALLSAHHLVEVAHVETVVLVSVQSQQLLHLPQGRALRGWRPPAGSPWTCPSTGLPTPTHDRPIHVLSEAVRSCARYCGRPCGRPCGVPVASLWLLDRTFAGSLGCILCRPSRRGGHPP